ncbi:hypothetical protein KW786_00020 [Candidatus Parcubacteria bacterium]|nr:hypothetical protein [Candidatus Parcubacteria bacterium]
MLAVFLANMLAFSVALADEPLPPDQQQPDTNVTRNAKIETTSAGLTVRVAPGELLPISIKLLNFGGGHRVDVTITYGIFDQSGRQIYATSETVAVETTATFVKTIQVPFEASPGKYIARASLVYQDQVVPATTQFPFIVEKKFFGLFQSDFLTYGGITVAIVLVAVIISNLFLRRRKLNRLSPLDYSNVSSDKRVFFEILSDTIMQMRLKVGDPAIEVASHINGLQIDPRTGRVLDITDNPSKVIALLVAGYEKYLGEKVSFSFRDEAKQ